MPQAPQQPGYPPPGGYGPPAPSSGALPPQQPAYPPPGYGPPAPAYGTAQQQPGYGSMHPMHPAHAQAQQPAHPQSPSHPQGYAQPPPTHGQPTSGASAAGAFRSELTLLSEQGVVVSSTRFVVNGTTFPLAGIQSVSEERVPPKRTFALLLTGLGLLCAATEDARAFGVILLIVGVAWLGMAKATHRIVVYTAGGVQRPLSSKDANLVGRVISALNQGIIQRG